MAVDFNTAYLAGYFADRYDVDVTHSIGRANDRIRNSTEETLRSTVKGYNTVATESVNVQIHEGDIHYALMPVWVANTEYRGKNYMFAMNGQSGKVVGTLPIDKLKLALIASGVFLGLFLIVLLLSGLLF